MKNECPNCGSLFAKNEFECKYCGTRNERYIKPAIEQPKEIVVNSNADGVRKKGFGFFVFILLLLIFCWPVAIIYVLIDSKK